MTTLLHMKALGVRDLEAVCQTCGCCFGIPITALSDVPDETLLQNLAALRNLACPECSAPSDVVGPEIRKGI